MPYVKVEITKDGVTAEQKKAVIKGITDVLVKVLNKNPESTFVVIDEIETDNWGHKGTSVTELRKVAAKPAKLPKPVKAKAVKPKAKKAKA
jgi:4-oxalocrotonate tautomerase